MRPFLFHVCCCSLLAWGLFAPPASGAEDGSPTGRSQQVAAWETVLREAPLLRDARLDDDGVRQLAAAAQQGRLSGPDLWRAALMASGVQSPAMLARCQRPYQAWREELLRRPPLDDPRLAVRTLLKQLHRDVLHAGYDETATDLRRVLDEGRYNCVSSVLLTVCLARELKLPVEAVEAPGHVLVRVVAADGVEEIETTCPECLEQPARTPPRSSWRRPLSDVQLLALVYYNQGVEQLGRHNYPAAAAANLRAVQLDPASDIAWGNLLASANNGALHASQQGRHAEAIDLLRRAMQLAPQHDNFLANEIHIHQTWIDELTARGDWRTALDRLDEAHRHRPHEPFYESARWRLLEQRAEALLDAQRRDDVLALFDLARRRYPDSAAPLRLEMGALNRRALAALEQEDFETALGWLELGLHRQPGEPTLTNNHRAVVERWALVARRNGDDAEAERRAAHMISHPR